MMPAIFIQLAIIGFANANFYANYQDRNLAKLKKLGSLLGHHHTLEIFPNHTPEKI